MPTLEPHLLILGGVVVSSLIALIAVLLTWPSAKAATDDVAKTASANSSPTKGGLPARVWSQDRLDDVIRLNGWESEDENGTFGQADRSKRGKHAPVTLKQRIIRAGVYNKTGVHTFYVVRACLAASLFCVPAVVGLLPFCPIEVGLLVGAMTGLAGYLIPSFWLDHRLRTRQTKMRRALPDALDLITVCMQGGLSLPGALARVSTELGMAHPMLATELAIVEREIQMGRATGESMRQFANRFHLEELRSLASVVGQAEKFGGSITGALKTYAAGLRTKRRQHAEEMAQKAAVKLLFPTLLCIFPGIFVVILGPTGIRVYQIMVENAWGG